MEKNMIGVLGGMGPYATWFFYKKVLDLTDALRDSDHLHIVIDINTEIPSRNRHFIFNELSPVDKMVEAINKLKLVGCNTVYIPCNSASYFIDEIKNKLVKRDVEVIGTIKPTLKHIISTYSKKNKNRKRVLVLGAHIVYHKEPYKEELEKNGFVYIKHDKDSQDSVEGLIYKIKKYSFLEKTLEEASNLIDSLICIYQVDILVLACTELCIVVDKLHIPQVDVIDSNNLLAKYLLYKEKGSNYE
jgi:aspartate racemase